MAEKRKPRTAKGTSTAAKAARSWQALVDELQRLPADFSRTMLVEALQRWAVKQLEDYKLSGALTDEFPDLVVLARLNASEYPCEWTIRSAEDSRRDILGARPQTVADIARAIESVLVRHFFWTMSDERKDWAKAELGCGVDSYCPDLCVFRIVKCRTTGRIGINCNCCRKTVDMERRAFEPDTPWLPASNDELERYGILGSP